MARRFAALVAVLLSLSRISGAADLDSEAVCAYGAGRFGDAAAVFTRSFGPSSAAGSYFFARSLAELGLTDLAVTHFQQAVATDDPEWARRARRELVRLQFERAQAGAGPEGIEQWRETGDAEIIYLAGLTAARQRRWAMAADLLGALPPGDALHPYARYARAQVNAAAGEFATALDDLATTIRLAPPRSNGSRGVRVETREALEAAGGDDDQLRAVFVPTAAAVSLADRAELLRGNILYLEGRMEEAQRAFGAVRADGRVALESARGLLLTGDVESAASRVAAAPPAAAATYRLAEALAVERGGDTVRARPLRTALRALARRRLETLERIASQPAERARIVADLVTFAAKTAQGRAELRWPQEEIAAGISCSFGPLDPVLRSGFTPADDLFYDVWDHVRSDRRLAALVEIGATSARLGVDLAAAAEASREPDLAARVLFALRVASLEQRAAVFPNENGIEKQVVTEKPISAFDSYATPLSGIGAGHAAAAGWPADAIGVIELMRARNRRIATDVTTELEHAIDAALRTQAAFFERIQADNESSLSRLYARRGSE